MLKYISFLSGSQLKPLGNQPWHKNCIIENQSTEQYSNCIDRRHYVVTTLDVPDHKNSLTYEAYSCERSGIYDIRPLAPLIIKAVITADYGFLLEINRLTIVT